MSVCPKCNTNNKPTAKFCGKCGEPVGQAYKQCKNGHFYQGDRCTTCPPTGDLARRGLRGRAAPPTEIESKDKAWVIPQDKTHVKGSERSWDKTKVGSDDGSGGQLVGWLVVVESKTEPKYKDFQLYDGRNTIRRKGMGQSKIGIRDPRVSGEQTHAFLSHGEGVYELWDNGSNNGTFINGTDIKKETVSIRDGDLIQVGDTVLAFRSFTFPEK